MMFQCNVMIAEKMSGLVRLFFPKGEKKSLRKTTKDFIKASVGEL